MVSWCSWLSRQSNTLKVSGSNPGEAMFCFVLCFYNCYVSSKEMIHGSCFGHFLFLTTRHCHCISAEATIGFNVRVGNKSRRVKKG